MIAPWIDAGEWSLPPESPYTTADVEEAVAAASLVLFNLSGRKYGGVRQVTEEYCQVGLDQIGWSTYYGPNRPPLPGASGYAMVYPELRHGVITNRIGGCCSSCGCTHLLRLRGGPILGVTRLAVAGKALDSSLYSIYDYSFISAPNRCWGTCDDIEVTYTYGTLPPVLGRMAAKALAEQFLLALAGDEECALPQRVTQISRQGMSMTLLDPLDFLDKGRTGIYQVDLFLATVNPDGARMRSRVFSPDIHRGRTKREPVAPTTMAAPAPFVMTAPMLLTTTATTTPATSSTSQVFTDPGRPLRWVVPGPHTEESPPTLVVRPSGEEVPPDALSWRTGNFTLDLSSEQVERLLPPGSVLVVSSTTGTESYLVDRRTP